MGDKSRREEGRKGGRQGGKRRRGEERRISRGSRGCRADRRQRTGLFERKPGAAGWLRREILGSALGPSQDCPAKQEPCGRPAPAGGAGRTIDKGAESAQAEQARAPEARAPSGAGTSGPVLRPRLTVRSRRETGESLESFWLAACSLPLGVPARPGTGSQHREECRGLRALPGLKQRRFGASAAQFAPCAPLWDTLPSSELSAEHTAPLWLVQAAGSRGLKGKPFLWGLRGYDELLSLSLGWVLMASFPTWQNRHEFA